jgi:hypothetical protein
MKTYKDFMSKINEECPCKKGKGNKPMKGKNAMKGMMGKKGCPMKKKANVSEDAMAFTYNDGGDDMTVVISGTKSELNKIKKKLPAGTKMIDKVPKDALKMTASDWSELQ